VIERSRDQIERSRDYERMDVAAHVVRARGSDAGDRAQPPAIERIRDQIERSRDFGKLNLISASSITGQARSARGRTLTSTSSITEQAQRASL